MFPEPGCVTIIVLNCRIHVELFVGGVMSTMKDSVWKELNIKSFLT